MLDLSELRDSLPSNILVIVLIVLLGAANLFFVMTVVLPHWQNYEQLTTRLSNDQETLGTLLAEKATDDMRDVLQARVTASRSNRDQLAHVLLTPAQADSFIERLYRYAAQYGVEITNLQAQQAPQTADNGVYVLRAFRLQASGSVRDLLETTAAMEEIAVPSVVPDEISIGGNTDGNSVLTMNIVIYTSPFASGELLGPVPEVQPTAAITPTPEAAAVNPEIASASVPVATPVECEGARDSAFQTGDTVIVDFNGIGALRVLKEPTGYDILTQVYDGTILHLLDGPVCGTWHEEHIFYWFVALDGMDGWVGEGDSADRWLCPLSQPECS